MSIHKLNQLVKKHRIFSLILHLILITSFIFPIINDSQFEDQFSNSLLFQSSIINEDVFPIIGKSNSFSSFNVNNREQVNEKESEQIIEKNIFFNRNELKYYLNLARQLAYFELPDPINFRPRSPPQILS